ncbi:MAG: hypothetical protein HFI45_05085 [Lachnospiraceae bacterium]|nr:hypothetical protein [Lachnospiraceae bacterium]MDE7008663.1 hypothetical protein [Lachnospiraceae bacterium]
METVNAKDRERLRSLAEKQAEYANSDKNKEVMKKWQALKEGRRELPTVRLLFSNFPDEVIEPRLKCTGEEAKEMERSLLSTLVGRELFDDDTPISATYDVEWQTYLSPFGIRAQISKSMKEKSIGYHIDPVIGDLDEDMDKLKGGSFGVDREGTQRRIDLASDLFGDILPVRMVMGSLPGAITNPLVALMGMENYYYSMYDYSDELHQVMDMACTVYENYYDFLEKENLLLPTVGISPVAQESFAFNSELPSENVTKTTQCWGFLEAQEATAISTDMFGEFVFPYQDRLAKRFGLLSYGCCERVDAIWPEYVSKWKHLRKLSVSPFNNERQVGEFLRGSNVVYYSKPRAEYVTNPGPLDEDAIREYFKGVAQAASGCLLEVAQREVGTIYGDFNRGKRYVELAKESIEKYWKP